MISGNAVPSVAGRGRVVLSIQVYEGDGELPGMLPRSLLDKIKTKVYLARRDETTSGYIDQETYAAIRESERAAIGEDHPGMTDITLTVPTGSPTVFEVPFVNAVLKGVDIDKHGEILIRLVAEFKG